MYAQVSQVLSSFHIFRINFATERHNISIIIMSKLRKACVRNRGLILDRHKKLFISKTFITALRTNQPPIQSLSGDISNGVKWPQCQPGHCPLSSTDFQNEWKNTHSFYAPSWRVRRKFCLSYVVYVLHVLSISPSLIQLSQQYSVTNCIPLKKGPFSRKDDRSSDQDIPRCR
jgi:hypothetical protein